jgi:hypothetical protein
MIRGTHTAQIDFERQRFLTRSREDIKLIPYSGKDLLDFIDNIVKQAIKGKGKNKEKLYKIATELHIIYQQGNG